MNLEPKQNKDGLWGYVDNKTNQWIIAPKFENAYDFSDGVACVYLNGKAGFIAISGNFVIEPKFEEADWTFSNGLTWFVQNKKTGFIDLSGTIVIEPKFDNADFFNEDVTTVRIGDKYGIIDMKGNFVVEPIFDDVIEQFADGKAQFEINGAKVWIDKTGKIIGR